MNITSPTCTDFAGDRLIAAGPPATVVVTPVESSFPS